MNSISHIACVGFGEAGGILGAGLAAQGVRVSMFDRQLDDPERAPAMLDRAARAGVHATATLAEAIDGAQLIVSAVTAGSDVEVATAVGGYMVPGQTFLDINSVSPRTKQYAQRLIEDAGGHYVESAVMAPVPPYGIAVPMLLGGAQAERVARQLCVLGFDARAISAEVGVASAVKMCRSVMVKGIEALTVECLRAARRYDAETIVLESLTETFSKLQRDADVPGYLIGRVAEHGRRRAAEMREVAQTLLDAGVEPLMSEACAQLQDSFADAMQARGVKYDAAAPLVWRELIDQLWR